MLQNNYLHQSPLIIFENEEEWHACLQWCLHQYGNTDWYFYHMRDLFGRYECQFKFLSNEDLVQFLLAWHNVE